jgi:uncharacterized protein involved in exopolysaccharide biosynthesis
MTDSPAASGRLGTTRDDEISLWEVLATLLRRRSLILRTVLVVAILAVVVSLLGARDYTTSASFRPQGSSGAADLAALASQFGVRVPTQEETESPAFYAELLTSRPILARVAGASYRIEGVGTGLAEFLGVQEDTPGLEEREVIRWLEEEVIAVGTGRETGIVHLDVTTSSPELSVQIAEELLREVGRFNLQTRQSQGAAERAFIEERVAAVEEELREAEAELLAHIQSNRQITSSPELQFQRNQLQDEVNSRRQLHSSLIQAYEEARISEVRDTPVLTVLQTPFFPPAPDDRRLLLRLALAIVLGGVLGVLLALTTDALAGPGVEPGSPQAEVRSSWNDLLSSIPLIRRGRTSQPTEARR